MDTKRVGLLGALIAMLVSACNHVKPPNPIEASVLTSTPPAILTPVSVPIPEAPVESAINEVEMLQEQVKIMEQNVFLLQEQVQRLTRQQVGMNQSIGVIANAQGTRANQPKIDTTPLQTDQTYARAYQQYQQKKYSQAIQTLKPYSSGGDGDNNASNGMYLLMLSHKNLKQCESTIAIGRQFQQRFPQHMRAAEALYSVGQCQYDMQQKDIARETWKRVRVLYPHSAAARMAAQQLK